MTSPPEEITDLLSRWQAGDAEALDRLIPLVYDRLRAIARQRLRAEPERHSLDTTGLVHETYLRLVDGPAATLADRSHFLALASRVMRHLLVDHARARRRAKRGGGVAPLELAEDAWVSDQELDAAAELDEALERLERLDQRQCRILEQRYFGGLSREETAEALGISLATVKRELRSARAWLALELAGSAPR